MIWEIWKWIWYLERIKQIAYCFAADEGFPVVPLSLLARFIYILHVSERARLVYSMQKQTNMKPSTCVNTKWLCPEMFRSGHAYNFMLLDRFFLKNHIEGRHSHCMMLPPPWFTEDDAFREICFSFLHRGQKSWIQGSFDLNVSYNICSIPYMASCKLQLSTNAFLLPSFINTCFSLHAFHVSLQHYNLPSLSLIFVPWCSWSFSVTDVLKGNSSWHLDTEINLCVKW